MTKNLSTQFTLVADLINKGDVEAALTSYLETFNRYGLKDNPARTAIILNLGYLFDIVGAKDPLYVIETAVDLYNNCSEAKALHDKVVQLFLTHAPKNIETLNEIEESKNQLDSYINISGDLIAGSKSEDEFSRCFEVYKQAVEAKAAQDLSGALFWAGLAARAEFPNPEYEKRFSDLWATLIHRCAIEEGPLKAAWQCGSIGNSLMRPGILQTTTAQMAMHYYEEALKDPTIPKSRIVNSQIYNFTSGSTRFSQMRHENSISGMFI